MTRSKDLNHFFKGLVTAGDEGGKWHDGAHRKHLNQGKFILNESTWIRS